MQGRSGRQLHPCFVLHRRDYSDTSLLVEVFARDFGRFPAIAKGAKRSRSTGAALLQPFRPLWLSWGGRGEVRTLHRMEAVGPAPVLAGKTLVCGFYLNELLVRLLGRDDPHEALFAHYHDALGRLAGDEDFEAVLRRFELQLLAEIGYALLLDREADSGLPVRRDRRYRYEPERGPVALEPSDHEPFAIAGETLLRLAAEQIPAGQGAREARYLLRRVLACYLGDKPLKSRELFRLFRR